MKIAEQLPIDQVISEWLKAEWYKSYFDNFREEYSQIVYSPDLLSDEENQTRKKLLESLRHDVITPLFNLSVSWYCLTLSSVEDYQNISIIPTGDWYEVSGTTFKVGTVPENLFHDIGHKEDIRKKTLYLQKHKRFDERMILVGSSENDLTVIEGNHRMVASLMHMQKNNISDLPQKVIAGFTDNIAKYRWSTQWEYINDFLSLCQKEEESFEYKPIEIKKIF